MAGSTNPLQAPGAQAELIEENKRRPKIGALVTILVAGWVWGFVMSPPDPVTQLINAVALTLLGVGGYLWGFRHGVRNLENS